MVVTLVSVSRITASGAQVLFDKTTCKIFNQAGVIGIIPKSSGLYRVYSPLSVDYAARAKEVLTIDELHRRLGHISHEAARTLVNKGLVLGVELEEDSVATVCEPCERAKMTRKPIRRVREGDRAAAVGNEIHSDVWGPAPVETIGHRRYYISFTDD
ncbi:hypothetical protein DFH05DRAFT_1362102, partial [Lentinula detonsa]